MDKKAAVVVGLKVVTGYHSIERVARDAKGSASRFRSIFSRNKSAGEVVDRMGRKYMVYSPFALQYGVVENDIFYPHGVVKNIEGVPENYKYMPGAYFAGDDLGELLKLAFNDDQLRGMISDGEFRKKMFLAGAVLIMVLSLISIAFGHAYGVTSLPLAVMFAAFALKNAIYAHSLQYGELLDVRGYLDKFGIFGWMVK